MPHSLTQLNTLKLTASCEQLITISSLLQLEKILPLTKALVLGGGSNMLFAQHYLGIVLHNQILGYEFSEDAGFHYLSVAGGENWHQMVMTCCELGIGGLENLALIPGSVGAAPIQNIGAYGVELASICVGVDAYSLTTGDKHYFSAAQCQFSYRDSMLKQSRDYFVSRVYFKLTKSWQPQLSYGELQAWRKQLSTVPTPIDVAQQVIKIRQAKLPDHLVIPNAGSFFKNPVLSQSKLNQLLAQFPDCPYYPAGENAKIAAGWLIDQLGLKGFNLGGAAVHPKQALVLINQAQATPDNFIELAAYIRAKVQTKFGVKLEPEVNFIAKDGYSSLEKMIDV